MNEEFLIYLWSQQLLSPELKTQQNEDLTIIKPGTRNYDSGPDFFNARLKIGKNIWAGNVEVHLKSSDWDKHQHGKNKIYDNIILHVVLEDDKPVRRNKGEIIPCLELKNKFNKSIIDTYESFMLARSWIACENQIAQIGHFELHSWLDKLTAERLEKRAGDIVAEFEASKFNFQEVFYRKLARAFGFNTNSQAFEMLAVSLPFSIITKHRSNLLQLEALLFGQAGFLNEEYSDEYPNKLKHEYLFLSHKYNLRPNDKKLWKFMRLRPSNFPTVRISQFASFIQKADGVLIKIFESEKLATILSLFQCSSSAYWENHYLFDKTVSKKTKKKIGATSVDLLLINTIIPFMFTYGQVNNKPKLQETSLDWLEKIKAENNIIIRNFAKNSIKPVNAFQSQALIQLYKEYCKNRRCLECRIGNKLMAD